MNIFQASRIVAAVMLLLALLGMPDAYYSALKIVVTAAAILEIAQILKLTLPETQKTAWALGFSAIAVVFNPILPLNMEREAWQLFNVFSAGVFLSVQYPSRWKLFIPIIALGVFLLPIFWEVEKEIERQESNRRWTAYLAQKEKEDKMRLEAKEAERERIRLEAEEEFLNRPALPGKISNKQASQAASELMRDKGIRSSDPQEDLEDSLKRDENRQILLQWEKESRESARNVFQYEFDLNMEVKTALPTTYIVQNGDNLYNVAKKLKVSVSDLIEANNLPRYGPIKEGLILKVP